VRLAVPLQGSLCRPVSPLAQFGEIVKSSSIKPPVVRIRNARIDAHCEVLVNDEEALVEQCVDIGSEKEAILYRMATAAAYTLDMGRLEHILFRAAGDCATTSLRGDEITTEGRLTLPGLDRSKDHLNVSVHCPSGGRLMVIQPPVEHRGCPLTRLNSSRPDSLFEGRIRDWSTTEFLGEKPVPPDPNSPFIPNLVLKRLTHDTADT